jgi:hypothetical protein
MDQTYVQHDGLAMGAPTSSILSEFYLKHLENSKIYDLLLKFNIIGYFRYVDKLLIIYSERTTDIEGNRYRGQQTYRTTDIEGNRHRGQQT